MAVGFAVSTVGAQQREAYSLSSEVVMGALEPTHGWAVSAAVRISVFEDRERPAYPELGLLPSAAVGSQAHEAGL